MGNKFHRLVVCLVLAGSYFFFPKYGFTAFDGHISCDSLYGHFLFPISHANIWHLLANCLCLFMLRCPMHLFVTYGIAVLCSFLPSFSLYGNIVHGGLEVWPEHTYGFSGVLFAMVGISWGKIHRFRDMIMRNKWILIIPAFIPHINFLIHIYCLLIGYLFGHYTKRFSCLEKHNRSCDKK